MLKLGLTGNYCTGLDEVASIFRRYKVPLFDADLVIKYLLFNSSEHIEKIRDKFGDSVFTNNILDLSKFDGMDPNSGFPKFFHLIKVLEWDIVTYYAKYCQANKDTNFTIFKSQILFEFGFNVNVNSVITVYVPDGMRVTDIQTHLGMKAADVFDMLKSEMDPLVKNKHSAYIIHNYDTYSFNLEQQISQIYRSIMKKCIREKETVSQ